MKENSYAEENIVHVAIVGRPNVGKSTLFNRLVKQRKSIVDDISGTTRDRLYERCEFLDKEVYLIDTGGMKYANEGDFDQLVDIEVNKAVVEADVLIYVCDVSGITEIDYKLVDDLRRRNKQIILVVNKVDDVRFLPELNDFYCFGLGDPVQISAMHGTNISELTSLVYDKLPAKCKIPLIEHEFNLAIVGEPNSGKSTLLNYLLQDERSVVSDLPGTTRDTVEEDFFYNNRMLRLVDTAGIKKKKKMKTSADIFSLYRSDKSIKRSDIVILLVDAQRGPQKDTKLIYQKVCDYGKACMIVINKWDLVKGVSMSEYSKHLVFECGFLQNTPIKFISAKNGRKVHELMNDVFDLWDKYNKSIPTKALNDFLDTAKKRNAPSPSFRLKYMVQVAVKPPSFLVFVKNKKAVTTNYLSYLYNALVRKFDFGGVVPQIFLREEKANESRESFTAKETKLKKRSNFKPKKNFNKKKDKKKK